MNLIISIYITSILLIFNNIKWGTRTLLKGYAYISESKSVTVSGLGDENIRVLELLSYKVHVIN